MLTQSQINRLTLLQRHATKYEAVVEADGLRSLLGYAHRSRSKLLILMRRHGQRLIDTLGIGETDTIEWLRPAALGAVCKDIAGRPYAQIRFSGRTERQAIMSGELRDIGVDAARRLKQRPAEGTCH